MQSPALPAIDGSAVDFGIFDSELNKEAAGYDDGVEGDDHPDHPLPIDVQIYMDEEEEMDKENYEYLCNFTKFPPESDSDHWVPNDGYRQDREQHCHFACIHVCCRRSPPAKPVQHC